MEDYSFLLNERIKEQKCLHEVIGLVRGGGKKDTVLQSITDLLPEGFLYPEYCQVSLRVSDRAEPYLSKDYRDPDHKEHYDIIVGGLLFGSLEVGYASGDDEKRTFLPEERQMLSSICSLIGWYAETYSSDKILKSQERQLYSLIEALDGFVYVSDPKTYELVFINNNLKKIFGEASIGSKCHKVLQNRDEPCPFCTNDLIFSPERDYSPYVWEFQNELTKRWYRCYDKAINWPGGKRMRFEMAIDITNEYEYRERIGQLNQDLLRSNQDLEQFAYVASHDLQEPLRMVSSYTQLLGNKYQDQLDEKAKKYIHYAVDGAVRMQGLINDLLSFSRISSRGKPFYEVDLHEVLGLAISNLQSTIEKSRALITNGELAVIHADRSQMIALFQNLLSNSIKFCDRPYPIIHISCERDAEYTYISFTDNGIGIDPKYYEKIFTIFQRLHTREEFPGTGIGLALCKKIMQRHGGDISVKEGSDGGSVFTITLPNEPADSQGASLEL